MLVKETFMEKDFNAIMNAEPDDDAPTTNISRNNQPEQIEFKNTLREVAIQASSETMCMRSSMEKREVKTTSNINNAAISELSFWWPLWLSFWLKIGCNSESSVFTKKAMKISSIKPIWLASRSYKRRILA